MGHREAMDDYLDTLECQAPMPADAGLCVGNADDEAVFADLTMRMRSIRKAKNHDYGNATSQVVDRYGYVGVISRIFEKLCRSERLMLGDEPVLVEGESVRDTLLDMAITSVNLIIEYDKRQGT